MAEQPEWSRAIKMQNRDFFLYNVLLHYADGCYSYPIAGQIWFQPERIEKTNQS
jgi:hypothetical protein